MTITKTTPTPSPTGGAGDPSAALAQILGAMGTGSAAGTGKVYMGKLGGLKGKDTSALTEQAQANLLARGGGPNWMSTVDAENQYFKWNTKQRQDFLAKGLLSGLLTTGAGDLEASALWKNLVDQAANYGAQGAKISPLDLLSTYVKGNSTNGWIKSSDGQFETNPVTGEKRYIGPKFKTTTQSSIDLTDPATARAVATSVWQDMLGRDPGQGEINAYAAALQASEQQNPSSTTTTTQYDPVTGEATNSGSVTTGGITDQGRQQLASDEIKKRPEYGATQAATTYMNELQAAVGGSG